MINYFISLILHNFIAAETSTVATQSTTIEFAVSTARVTVSIYALLAMKNGAPKTSVFALLIVAIIPGADLYYFLHDRVDSPPEITMGGEFV